LGGQATKSIVLVRPKDLFCVNFGSKLSLKGKPGTSALLETLQSPVDFFPARKDFWTAAGILYSAYIFL
jgi:hypothetical protein